MQCKRRLCPHRKYVMYDGILGTPSNFCVPSKWLKTPKLSKTSAVIPCICWKQGVPSWCDNPPTCKKYAPVLHRKTPCMFWPSLLVCAAPYGFFLGPPVCCLQFCMVLPSFLHSLPRLNGLERGMCHLGVPPFARCMHPSCVESSMYVLTFTFGLRCSFSMVFSWVLESSSVSSTTILHGSAFISRLNGPERGVCHLSVPPFCKKVVLRRYTSFFWNWRAWMCHLSVSWQPPKKCLATQKRLTPCWFLCEAIGFEVLLFIFRSVKEGKPNHPKGSFSSSFHLSRTGCAWMCHLSVPW